jgi:hypothetical protein
MRFLFTLTACVCLIAAETRADSRVFILANQPDGYGVDECLAKGEKCGAHAARAYCQARDFVQATGYRRIDPDEVTGAIPASIGTNGSHGEFIAITCHR